ncbi:MAG: single-stranded DNA-binding protein [Verrucomicrobiota bacterium]|nr:single-stranded DNA-binding protein [Verrucomicrobiota bacterium]
MNSDLLFAAGKLRDDVDKLKFENPVHCVYNPLDYAWAGHEQYLQRFGIAPKKVLFLGMNPGPWGMAQTGVPFGEIQAVRDWMQINVTINKPGLEHPKRPIQGFACQKSEVSGRRLWGLFQKRYETASAFFQDHFVVNYCPLIFMNETGANLTPDKLPSSSAKNLFALCDAHLQSVISILNPDTLVGVGGFAETCFKRVAPERRIIKIIHPSPASPAANRDWEGSALKSLRDAQVWK